MARSNFAAFFCRFKFVILSVLLFSVLAIAGRYFDRVDVDNIRIDGNTISSTNTNGDITLTPNGSGNIIASPLSTGSRFLESGGSGEVLESGLTTTEGDQLENINATTISSTQWGYLGALDQALATTDSPTFAGLTLSGLTADTVPYLNGSKVFTSSSVNSTELGQLANIDATTISATQWGYLGGLDQDLQTVDSVQFAALNLSGLTTGRALFVNGVGGIDVSTTTTSELATLSSIDSVTITNAQWGYVGDLDQALTTSDTPSFNGITLTGNLDTNLVTAGAVISDATGVISAETQLAISRGGTGAATASTAFDALSPMTTSGDIIYGGASGTGTRLASGS